MKETDDVRMLLRMLGELEEHLGSQHVLADKLGVGQGTVSKWLNRAHTPRRSQSKIIDLYNREIAISGGDVSLAVNDPTIRRVVELMVRMTPVDRNKLLRMAQIIPGTGSESSAE